ARIQWRAGNEPESIEENQAWMDGCQISLQCAPAERPTVFSIIWVSFSGNGGVITADSEGTSRGDRLRTAVRDNGDSGSEARVPYPGEIPLENEGVEFKCLGEGPRSAHPSFAVSVHTVAIQIRRVANLRHSDRVIATEVPALPFHTALLGC